METMIQMKRSFIFSIVMALVTTAVLLGATPLKIYAGESVVIRSLNLKFDSQFGDQEILMPRYQQPQQVYPSRILYGSVTSANGRRQRQKESVLF